MKYIGNLHQEKKYILIEIQTAKQPTKKKKTQLRKITVNVLICS